MSIRTVKLELEAKLTGKSGGLFSRSSGKVERKAYGDGGARLKISIRNLEVPDQSIAVIKADGEEIAKIPVVRGAARVDNESKVPSALPALGAGQTIEVQVNGATVLSGKLYVD